MDRSFRATALSLLLLSVSSLAPACAASDSNPGPDRSLQNARVTGTRPGSGRGGGNNNKVKILVQYDKTSPSKMQMVPAAIQARGLNMVKDIERYGIMVVEVPESTAEKLVEEQFLRGLDGVLEVEDDTVMSVIPGLPEEGEMVKDGAGNYVVSKSGGDGRRAEEREGKQLRRRLTEETPWGITQVQADQVEAGAYKDDIMVCVVDTGYTPNVSCHFPLSGVGGNRQMRRNQTLQPPLILPLSCSSPTLVSLCNSIQTSPLMPQVQTPQEMVPGTRMATATAHTALVLLVP